MSIKKHLALLATSITAFILIATIILTPYLTGFLIKKDYAKLVNAIPRNAAVSVKLIKYERHWLTSTATLQVTLKQNHLTFDIEQHIDHGPILLTQQHGLQLGMAYFSSKPGWRNNTISAEGILSYQGNLKLSFSTPTLTIKKSRPYLDNVVLTGLTGSLDYRSHQKQLLTQLFIQKVETKDASLNQAKLNANLTMTQPSTIAIKIASLKVAGKQPFFAQQIKILNQLSPQGKTANLTTILSFDARVNKKMVDVYSSNQLSGLSLTAVNEPLNLLNFDAPLSKIKIRRISMKAFTQIIHHGFKLENKTKLALPAPYGTLAANTQLTLKPNNAKITKDFPLNETTGKAIITLPNVFIAAFISPEKGKQADFIQTILTAVLVDLIKQKVAVVHKKNTVFTFKVTNGQFNLKWKDATQGTMTISMPSSCRVKVKTEF